MIDFPPWSLHLDFSTIYYHLLLCAGYKVDEVGVLKARSFERPGDELPHPLAFASILPHHGNVFSGPFLRSQCPDAY